jgi:diketogulonate reductase-like aldo/keto reductase
MDEPLVKEIAAKRKCSPAQVCLKLLKRGTAGPV